MRLEAVGKLGRENTVFVDIMEELTRDTSTKLRIRELSTRNERIKIKAWASELSDISKFKETLETSDYLDEVSFGTTESVQENGRSFREMSISAHIISPTKKHESNNQHSKKKPYLRENILSAVI